MKFGFSSNAYTKKSLLYAIDSISKIGYDGIEIVLDAPHAFLPLKPSYLENIKKKIKENHVEISNLNCNTVLGWYSSQSNIEKFEPSLSNLDEKLRNWRINYVKSCIDVAVNLDAPSICVTSGLLPTNNPEKNISLLYNSLDNISAYAEKYGKLIAIEYEPGLLIGNWKDVHQVTNSFKNIGLNLDTCHVAVLKEDMAKIVQFYKKKIFHTHISDCKNNEHFHLVPGLGSIDFKGLHHSLQQISYQGFLTAELYPYDEFPEQAAIEAINYLKRVMD